MRENAIAVLEARIAQLEARKTAAVKRQSGEIKKLQNRRKYLLGAYILGTVSGEISRLAPDILSGLDAWATRPRDRDVLGLPSRPRWEPK